MRSPRQYTLALALGFSAWLAGLASPPPAAACLPAAASDNFSFADRLELAVVGTVTAVRDRGEQYRYAVEVQVKTTIAGDVAGVVEVRMDDGGGCERPRGDIGDRIVIAAGAPGANYGTYFPWSGDYLSPYNSAQWIVASDGTIESGPKLDGQTPADVDGLLSALLAPRGPEALSASHPEPSPPVPSPPVPSPSSDSSDPNPLGVLLLLIAGAVLIAVVFSGRHVARQVD